jgi:urea transporter
MWSLETRWFDVAVVMSIFAFGSILFGHFEAHRPKWRRVLKVLIFLGVTIALAETGGRAAAYGLLAIPALAAAYIHLVWLPKHGINGWTGEPREKYLALVTKKGRR